MANFKTVSKTKYGADGNISKKSSRCIAEDENVKS